MCRCNNLINHKVETVTNTGTALDLQLTNTANIGDKEIKNTYNNILEIIYLIENNKLIINDELTKNYINTLEKDIKEYKDITNLNNCINASVIYRNPTVWYDELIINKGSSDNIKENSVVINNTGIVGVITKVYDTSSIISLITNINKDKKITVGITNDEVTIYGIINKYDKYKNELIISEITKDIEITDNLNVITTSFTNVFKEGIIIGKVKKIENDSNGLSKNVIATPTVDYNNIKYVCVENK